MNLGMTLGLGPLDERMTREDLLRVQRMEAARRSSWTELEYADLEPGRRGTFVHKRTGARYRPYHGLVDPAYPSPVTAFARRGAKGGTTHDVVLLEPA